MRADSTTHRERIIFFLCCNASESLNRNCQQGKSPILQLRPQRDSGNRRLYFLDFFSAALVTETAAHLGGKETRQSQTMPKILPHLSHSGPLKGTDQPGGNIIGRGLWKSIRLLTSGASTKAISYSTFYTRFLTKKKLQFQNSMNYRFHSHVSYPLSPPTPVLSIFQSPTIDMQLLSHSLLQGNRSVFCLGVNRLEWYLPVNPIILDHSNPLQVALHGFISIGWDKDLLKVLSF